MNRNKNRFLTIVFSCFMGLFIAGNAFASVVVYTSAWTNNYTCCNSTFSGHYASQTISDGSNYCATNQQVTITRGTNSTTLGRCYSQGAAGYVNCVESITTVTYTCATCTMGTYTGPNGDTFCCDYYHLENLGPMYSQNITPSTSVNNGAYCSSGQFVCNSYVNGSTTYPRVRLIDKDAVSNASTGTLANRTVQGFDNTNYTVKPNYVCTYAFGNSETGLLRPSGYTVEGCGTVGSGSTNNTTFKNCKISKVLTGKTGCKYNSTNGNVKEVRTLNTSYNYGNSGDTSGYYYGYDKTLKKFFGNSGDVSSGNYNAASIDNWTGVSYNFDAQAGYKKNPSSGTCTQCGAGTYSAGGGATSCSNCNCGKYGTSAGASSCTGTCAAGTYSDCSGAKTSCTACTDNTYSKDAGASSCQNVPYNATVNSTHTGIDCDAGTYRVTNPYSGENWYYCADCPTGSGSGVGNTIYAYEYSYGTDADVTAPRGSTSISACYAYREGSDTKGSYTNTCNNYSGDDMATVGINTSCWYNTNVYYIFPGWYSRCSMDYWPWAHYSSDPGDCIDMLIYHWSVGGSGSWTFIYVPMGIAQLLWQDAYYSGHTNCFTYYDSL